MEKRAIKIDSTQRRVYDVVIGEYTDLYTHIGNGCETFACPVELGNGDSLFVDDEGLYNPTAGFMFNDWDTPISGNALLLNYDYDGESADALSTIEEIEERIIWVSAEDIAIHAERALNTPPKIYFF